MMAGFLPRRLEFNPVAVYMGFILDEATVRQVYLPLLRLSLPIVISRMFQSLNNMGWHNAHNCVIIVKKLSSTTPQI
jgi:hypothetical protein